MNRMDRKVREKKCGDTVTNLVTKCKKLISWESNATSGERWPVREEDSESIEMGETLVMSGTPECLQIQTNE